MTVLDTTFLLHHLVGFDLKSHLSGMGLKLDEIHILSATVTETIEGLLDMGFNRRAAAKSIMELVSSFSVEDATLHLYACFVFAKSNFSYADCLNFAYARLDNVEPLFLNKGLSKAFEEGRFHYTGEENPL